MKRSKWLGFQGSDVVIAALALIGVLPISAQSGDDPVLDASGLPVPAWQTDSALATKWRGLAGRYVYQQACTSCHGWGPDHFDRPTWESYLSEFPDNHEPDVKRHYGDLTAQFTPGRMVPNMDQRTDALTTFLLSSLASAPTEEEPWDGFPKVGEAAPEFEIVDLMGRKHSLETYLGKKRLVLVFSRAHW
jgi:hypothetical protein